MDIWRWVNETEARLRKEGHGRLADLVDRIPGDVCNDRHERVDAVYPEALALAKSLELPWLEVFLRHWSLQSRILHRMDGNALGEAVSLVEFAHRDETRDCPQGICAVQDLASCYGFVDHSGYAEERLEVSRETLARIDETWPCFTCISNEYSSALRSKGDVEGSLAFTDAQIARLVARGDRDAAFDFQRDRIESLIELGRFEEALGFVNEAEKRGRKDAHHRLSRRIDRARLLARLGRHDEAVSELPGVEEVSPTPFFYALWIDAASVLADAGAIPNDAALGRVLEQFIERLARQSVGRTTLELAEIHGRLALDRSAPHVARRALAAMERTLPLLHRPLDALDRIAKMRRAIEAHPPASAIILPHDAETFFLEFMESETRDAERDLLRLEAAHARFPEHTPILMLFADCLLANGLQAEAIEHLAAFHGRTGHDDVALRLGELLVSTRDEQRLERMVQTQRKLAQTDASRALADWVLGRDAFARGLWSDCIQHLDRVLAARPDAINTRLLWAEAARKTGDFAGALAKLDEVVARGAEPGPYDWDRMVVATLLSQHAKVRDSAARLGIELEASDTPDAPIDERWELCRLRFDDDATPWAVRTGPVSARVLQIARPPQPQRYDDVVVFDARPLGGPPGPPRGETPDERPIHTYAVVATLHEGGFRAFELDGVHPGEAAFEQIEERLRVLGCAVQILSDEDYTVTSSGAGGSLPGLFAMVAVPRDCATADVSALLRETTASFAHPLTWRRLAADAGDEALVAAHEATIAQYGL